ncbi:TonB-dependent receptor [Providencia manganoxydans]|uniref:TonB-dependent receptor n=1 Tax=Providencia manganoxydans TaxID=2923283 RepID=A0ABX7AAK4_9GAMM|nr:MULTISPECIES: TonB-dependent receptor [Providencia]MDX4944053.1 TonB-dependent receptor [Providencia manganoxydans]QQO60984.1 TonB-dependent receptor [Providencia manganoxydans]HEF8772337.1 TonB-dependent receptor [Providencia stuartii]
MEFKLMSATSITSLYGQKIAMPTLVTALALTGFSASASTKEKDVVGDTIHVKTPPFQRENIAVAEQVDVIDAQSPEYQSATSALDLLKGQAGIFVSGTGGTYGQEIHMRGYDSRGVKVTVDNITQDFYSGLYEATFIDPSLVKKVYVHKGASSVAHGSGALAGVVAMKTVDASDLLKKGQNFGGRVFSGINRNDHSYLAGASLYGRTKSLDTLLSYSQRKKYLLAPPEISTTDHHEKVHNWALKTTWHAHPAYTIALQLREYRNDGSGLKQPTVFDTGNKKFKNTPHERYSHQRDLAINQHFSPQNSRHWQADWDLYYTDLFLGQLDLVKQKTDKKYQREERNQYTYGSKFAHHFMVPVEGWFNNHIENGIEYYQQQQNPNLHANSYPQAQLSNLSGWINNDMTLHHLPITFSAGTRFTRYESSRKDVATNKDTNWSSRFAVSVTPTNWLNLYSSYSEGYRAPRMTELYNNSNHFKAFIFSSDFRPSPDLKPETNKTLEVGSKLSFDDVMTQGDTLQLGSTYFTTKAKNYIVAEGRYEKKYNFREGIFQWFPHEIFYANIPSASIHGLDSFISYKNHWFDLNINYNQTTGTEDNTGHSLSSIRPETLSVRFNAPIATTGINLGWIGEFAAKTQLQGSDKYKLQQHKSQHGVDRKHREVIQYAGYSLHDFYVNYQADQFIKGLSTTLTLKNAFDRQYVSSMGVPQEGRNFYFNVSYQW